MSSPTVSIVVPAHNSAGYIGEALESAAKQTFSDHEIIVIDDASQDDTVATVRRVCPRATVIVRPENGGPACSRNDGIRRAAGEWIAFLDADDVWVTRRLEIQLDAARRLPDAGMFCAPTLPCGAAEPPARHTEQARRLDLDAFATFNPVATSTVLARRSILEKEGGFDPRFRGPEDYDLWLRVAARAPVWELASPLAFYRYRAQSLSTDDRRFLPEVLRVVDKAYGPGGALHGRRGRNRARAYHYLACSWMAAERRAPGAALRLFTVSLILWPLPFTPYTGRRWSRTKLLARFARVFCSARPSG